jgi:hypothetical protein
LHLKLRGAELPGIGQKFEPSSTERMSFVRRFVRPDALPDQPGKAPLQSLDLRTLLIELLLANAARTQELTRPNETLDPAKHGVDSFPPRRQSKPVTEASGRSEPVRNGSRETTRLGRSRCRRP